MRTSELALLAAWVLLGAATLIAYAVNLSMALRSPLSRRWKGLACVPPLAPVALWRIGKRTAPLAFLCFFAAYVFLRALG